FALLAVLRPVAGLGVLGVFLTFALLTLAGLAFALEIGLGDAGVLVVGRLGLTLGEGVGVLGDAFLVLAQCVRLLGTAIGPGANDALLAADFVQPLEHGFDALPLFPQLLVAIVGEENLEDELHVLHELVIGLNRRFDLVEVGEGLRVGDE